jgi:hypothetical protein
MLFMFVVLVWGRACVYLDVICGGVGSSVNSGGKQRQIGTR